MDIAGLPVKELTNGDNGYKVGGTSVILLKDPRYDQVVVQSSLTEADPFRVSLRSIYYRAEGNEAVGGHVPIQQLHPGIQDLVRSMLGLQ